MVIAKVFIVPDTCPEACKFKIDALCFRCPVMVCSPPKIEEDKKYLPVVEPDDYREDWAAEWEQAFEKGIVPNLFLMPGRGLTNNQKI